MDDEADLIAALREGDSRAFDVLYDRHRPRVFGFLARLSGDRQLAEDLAQETFLRLASRTPRLDAATRLRPWLLTVARNLFIDHLRRAHLDLDRLRSLALWPDTARAAAATPFDLTRASDVERRLEHALARLPPDLREAVLLVVVEGLTAGEAARVAGIRPDALRQRLARARTLLRDALETDR